MKREIAPARIPRRDRQPSRHHDCRQSAAWERDGVHLFQNMLQAHPDLDTVFACSDLMALGAVERSPPGRSGRIRVVVRCPGDARKAIGRGMDVGGAVAGDGPARRAERRAVAARQIPGSEVPALVTKGQPARTGE
jgi:ABC-type sugar transport system substrate-binding protein